MRQLLAINRRETSAFFHSAIAPIVLLGFLVLVGLFFTLFTFGYSEMSLNASQSGNIGADLNLAEGLFQPVLADIAIFLLFLLPAVSMRLFAEEYRSGRYDLVMSYPVPDHIWVGGKALSIMMVAAVLIAAGAIYFVVAAALRHPEPGPLLAAALGLLLLSGAIAAWGTFFSTLLQYQIVSYFLTFAFVLILYILDGLAPYLSGWLQQVVVHMSWRAHFERFSWGVVDSRDILFFLSWAALGLSAATASLSGRRQALGRRPALWLPTLLLALLLVVLNVLAARWPLSGDWTANQRYSLAPQTKQVLAALDTDVRIQTFYPRLDPQRKAIEVLLRACRDHCPRIQYEMLDPERDLALVEKYDLKAAGSVVVEAGGRHTVLLEPTEGPLINAIYRLATGSRPVICHLLGHGEHQPDSDDRGGYSAYRKALTDNGYVVQDLLLADQPVVPANADILVISAPKLEFAPAEIEAIQSFIRGGGAVLALLDPGSPDTITEWAAGYNLRLGNDFIVSAAGNRRQFGVDARVVVIYDTYGEHPLTRGLNGLATLFPFTQSIQRIHAGLVGVTGSVILQTDRNCWAEKDALTVLSGKPEYRQGVDIPGPVVFGVALEIDRESYFGTARQATGPRRDQPPEPPNAVLRGIKELEEGQTPRSPASIFSQEATSRVVVIGDSDFAANANLNLYANRDLLLNIMAWLAREKVLIEVRAHASIGQPLILSVGQKELIGWLAMLAWPLLVATICVLAVIRHRRRR